MGVYVISFMEGQERLLVRAVGFSVRLFGCAAWFEGCHLLFAVHDPIGELVR